MENQFRERDEDERCDRRDQDGDSQDDEESAPQNDLGDPDVKVRDHEINASILHDEISLSGIVVLALLTQCN